MPQPAIHFLLSILFSSNPPPAPEQAPSEAPKEEKAPAKFKNRINTWLKDSEEDASQAKRYLNLKKEKKKQIEDGSKAKGESEMKERRVKYTVLYFTDVDVIRAMEAIENTTRKKTPPSDTERKKQLIR